MGQRRRTEPNEGDPTPSGRRLTVHDAARELGISEDAVRMRVKRETLTAVREAGRLYVLLESDPTAEPTADPRAELVDELRDRVRYLEGIVSTRDDEIRRRDVIISQLTERIPAIEAPQEPPESPTAATEQPGRAQPRASTGATQAAPEAPSEAEPSLLWERIAVVLLSILGVIILLWLLLSTDVGRTAPGYVAAGSGALAWVVFPAVFGFRLGRKVSSLRVWRNVAPVAALLGLVGFIGGELVIVELWGPFLAFVPSSVYTFAAVFGNALRRRQREKLVEERPSDFPQESAATAQGWTARQQAIVGLVGTILSALIGLIGTILTVLVSG